MTLKSVARALQFGRFSTRTKISSLVLVALLAAVGVIGFFVRSEDTTAALPSSELTSHVASATESDSTPSPTSPAITTKQPDALVGPHAILLARAGTSGIYSISTADGAAVEWQPAWGNFEWLDGHATKANAPVRLVFEHAYEPYTSPTLNFRVRALGDAPLGVYETAVYANGKVFTIKITVST